MTVVRGELLGQGATTQTRLVERGPGVVGVEKRLLPRLRGDEIARSRLRTEIDVLRALAGRGAPSLLGSGDDEHGPWLLMEHVPMGSLAEVAARDSRGRAAVVTSVADAVFGALATVHEAGDERGPLHVIHGDISPDNLLVAADDGSARLVDFGLAWFRDASLADVSSGGLHGTPRYVAPEVARGVPPTVQSDLFALGLTLLHAASGEPPRSSHALAPLVVEAGEQPVVAYAERASLLLPARVRDALIAVVAFEPADRPPTAREAWRHGAW